MSKKQTVKTGAIIEIGTGFIDGWYLDHTQRQLQEIAKGWDKSRPQYKHVAVELIGEGFYLDDNIYLPNIWGDELMRRATDAPP